VERRPERVEVVVVEDRARRVAVLGGQLGVALDAVEVGRRHAHRVEEAVLVERQRRGLLWHVEQVDHWYRDRGGVVVRGVRLEDRDVTLGQARELVRAVHDDVLWRRPDVAELLDGPAGHGVSDGRQRGEEPGRGRVERDLQRAVVNGRDAD